MADNLKRKQPITELFIGIATDVEMMKTILRVMRDVRASNKCLFVPCSPPQACRNRTFCRVQVINMLSGKNIGDWLDFHEKTRHFQCLLNRQMFSLNNRAIIDSHSMKSFVTHSV